MFDIGNNFNLNSRLYLDSRQIADSLEALQNKTNVLYPPGFEVYCKAEKKWYQNTADEGATPIWTERPVGTGGGGNANIDDNNIGTDVTYSNQKIENRLSEVNAEVTNVSDDLIDIDTRVSYLEEKQLEGAEVDLSEYQRITDETLETTNKTVPGAINEINEIMVIAEEQTGDISVGELPVGGSDDAKDILITDEGGYYESTNVEGALQEVGQLIQTLSTPVIEQVIEPEELDMPRVFIYGDALPTTKTDVLLTMDYISNTDRFSSYIKLKCQGTSSMSYAKKNFTINMYSDEARETKLKKDFKGWGAQSKFCLKANYVDTTHTRNLSGARIGYDMVASRPDSTFKQQLLQCPRNGLVDGFPIKLYFNGEFYGIYTWNIPKDAWMFNMDESNPNHVVLCAEKNTDGNSSLINSCQFRQLWTNGDGQDWSVEVGTMSEDLRTKFNRVIAFVMNATDQEFHDNIGEYFDLYSLLDYYCFSYLTCHIDGLAKNMLMVTYDGTIWGASLYDMDSIYGANWQGTGYFATNYQCPEQYQEQFSRLWQRIEACFGAELYARYLELRQGALSLSNIVKHVEEIYDVIPDRVFTDEKAKWTSLPQVATNTMTRFRNYMRDRAVYVDAQMLEIGTPSTDVPCTGITLDKDTLALGVVGNASDLGTNLLDGAEWLDGNISETDGSITNGTDKYTEIRVNTLGKYTLSSTIGYTYKRIAMLSNDGIFIYSTLSGNNTSNVVINIFEPSIVRISAYPNSLDWDSTALSFTGVSFNEAIVNKDITYELTASDINVRYVGTEYVFAELYFDKIYNDISLVKYDGNNYKTAFKTSMNGNDATISAITNFNNLGYAYYGSWNGKTFLYTALPIAYGTTAEEILANMTSTTLTMNSSLLIDELDASASQTEKLSGRITATVTPDNCTDAVVWSVSPTGIVTVDSGLVTALANGNATVTATCGSYSDTCSVTVSGIGESGGDTDIYTTAEYAITEPRTFDGSVENCIDTGIQLFDTAKTFTIFVDYASNTADINSQLTVFHCVHETSPWRGICMMRNSDTDTYFIGGQASAQTTYATDIPSTGKYLISFVDGIINSIATVDSSGSLVYSATDMASNNPYAQVTENLLIGCYQNTSGKKDRFWKGTINKFGVWFKTLTNDEIKNLTGCNNVETVEDSTIETTYTNGYIARSTGHISGGNVSLGEIITTTGDITSDFISCEITDTFTINIPSTQYGCGVVAYDSSQSYLYTYIKSGTSYSWSNSPTNGADITGTTVVEVNNLPENTAYIRICVNTTDSSSVTITKHSIVYY